MTRRRLVVATAVLFSPAWLVAQSPEPSAPQPGPSARGVEPRADQELQRMGSFLAKTGRFAFEAEETFTVIEDREPKIDLTTIRRVAIVRPNRAAADTTGDTLNRASWYDGKSLTILDKEHNTYAVLDAAPTIDRTLDKMEDEYGVVLPLTDILYSDPYAVLIQKVNYGRYLGLHLAAGVQCHHLVFAQDTIEWQIWIDAGERPVPRKLVITYVSEPGEPEYTAILRRWRLNPDLPDKLFVFEPPEGARRVDAKELKFPGQGSKPAQVPGPKGGR